jgi:hypothetical protein
MNQHIFRLSGTGEVPQLIAKLKIWEGYVRRYLFISSIICIFAPMAVCGIDISGEWSARVTESQTTSFEFVADGLKLTGAVIGFYENECPILDGKIEKDKISFSLQAVLGKKKYGFRYYGVILSDDTIEFTIKPGKKWTFLAKRIRQTP